MTIEIFWVKNASIDQGIWALYSVPGNPSGFTLDNVEIPVSSTLGAVSSGSDPSAANRQAVSFISALIGELDDTVEVTLVEDSKSFMEMVGERRRETKGYIFPVKLKFSVRHEVQVDTLVETIVSVPVEGGGQEERSHFSRQLSEFGILDALFHANQGIERELAFTVTPVEDELTFEDIFLDANHALTASAGLTNITDTDTVYKSALVEIKEDAGTRPFDINRYGSKITLVLSNKVISLDNDLSSYPSIAADDSVAFCGFEKRL